MAGIAWVEVNQILIVIGNTVGFAIRSCQKGAARSAEGRAIQFMGAIAVDDLFGAGKVMGIGRAVFFANGVFGPIAPPRATDIHMHMRHNKTKRVILWRLRQKLLHIIDSMIEIGVFCWGAMQQSMCGRGDHIRAGTEYQLLGNRGPIAAFATGQVCETDVFGQILPTILARQELRLLDVVGGVAIAQAEVVHCDFNAVCHQKGRGFLSVLLCSGHDALHRNIAHERFDRIWNFLGQNRLARNEHVVCSVKLRAISRSIRAEKGRACGASRTIA